MNLVKPIRVLHIIKNFNLGGAETNLLNLIRATDGHCFEVHVGYSKGGEIEDRFLHAGAKLFKYASEDHKIKSLATCSIVARLVAYIRQHGLQIIHTHNFNAHVWGLMAAKLTGVKLIEHVHDFRYVESEDYKRRHGNVAQYRTIQYFKGWSDIVVVLTKQNKDFLVRRRYYTTDRVREIRNGIPFELSGTYSAEETRRRFGLDEKALVVLTSARISAEKNIGLILDIAPEVTRQVPNVQFVIAGDGPLKNELEQRARTEGLTNVRFIGFCADMHEWLNAADVFLLPSFLELHSIAILEALSRRLPVFISRDVGCNSEIFRDDHDGVLRDPFSPKEWEEALVELLRDPVRRRRIGENGYALCRNRFDIAKTAHAIESVYKQLIGG